jgi:hypothetical protein
MASCPTSLHIGSVHYYCSERACNSALLTLKDIKALLRDDLPLAVGDGHPADMRYGMICDRGRHTQTARQSEGRPGGGRKEGEHER